MSASARLNIRRALRRSPLVANTLLGGLIVLALVAGMHARLDARQARSRIESDPSSMLPSRETLDLLSLGYHTFAADLIWVRALQYRERRVTAERKLAPLFADAIIHLDPDFQAIYRWAAITMAFSGGISVEGVRKSTHYLELGMARFPDDPYYPYTIALNYAFYLPAANDDERRAKKAKAVEYLQIAQQKANPPSGIPLLIAGLLREDEQAKLAYMEQAYLTESDPEVRRTLESHLFRLAGSERRRAMERQRRTRDRWLHAQFDYLPAGLAFHLGERLRYISPATPAP